MKKTQFLVIAISLICFGCSGYQKDGLFGGYSSMCVQDNIYKISFRGNAYTSSEKASDFALLRSAEIALENGCRYFAILDKDSYTKTSVTTTPITTHHSGSMNMHSMGNMAHGSYSGSSYTTGGESYAMSKPRTSQIIAIYKEKPDEVFCFDAEQITSNIRNSYNIKPKAEE